MPDVLQYFAEYYQYTRGIICSLLAYIYSIDWTEFTKFLATQKDWALVLAALSAFIISLTTLIFTISSKRADSKTAASKGFEETISDIIDLRQKREELRFEMGSKWDDYSNTPLRVAVNDKREVLVARARYLIRRYKTVATDASCLIVGAALADMGRNAESLQYYKESVKLSRTNVSQAMSMKPYGRALILAGKTGKGRKILLKSAKIFKSLENNSGYDRETMRFERADTYRRLVAAQLAAQQKIGAAKDYALLKEAIAALRDPNRAKALEDASSEIHVALSGKEEIFQPGTLKDDAKAS